MRPPLPCALVLPNRAAGYEAGDLRIANTRLISRHFDIKFTNMDISSLSTTALSDVYLSLFLNTFSSCRPHHPAIPAQAGLRPTSRPSQCPQYRTRTLLHPVCFNSTHASSSPCCLPKYSGPQRFLLFLICKTYCMFQAILTLLFNQATTISWR